MLLGLVHGDLIGLRADDQTQTVVAVYSRDAGFFADNFDGWLGIDSAELEHLKIRMQPCDAMRIYAAEIALGQHIGSQRRVCFRDAEMHKYLRGEIAQIAVGVNSYRAIFVHRSDS